MQVRFDKLEDFIEEARKDVPVSRVFYQVEHTQLGALNKQTDASKPPIPARVVVPLMRLTIVHEDDYYTCFVMLGKETMIATQEEEAAYAAEVNKELNAKIAEIGKQCPAARLYCGVITP